jgi:RNA polymerase subunit RPABC4/transcription elongation factor Spt4
MKKMKPCRVCEKMIAKSADKCPICGGSQQSALTRFLLLICLAAMVLVIFALLGWIL